MWEVMSGDPCQTGTTEVFADSCFVAACFVVLLMYMVSLVDEGAPASEAIKFYQSL